MSCFNPPGGFGAFGTELSDNAERSQEGVSIRRADLGLLELGRAPGGEEPRRAVSIRRADLGLLERAARPRCRAALRRFNPPGGFGAFGTFGIEKSIKEINEVSIRRADLGLLERDLGDLPDLFWV